MAVKIWKSISSTDATTAANYSDAAAPEAGDTIIFNGTGTAAFSTNITFAFAVHLIVEPAHSGFIRRRGYSSHHAGRLADHARSGWQ